RSSKHLDVVAVRRTVPARRLPNPPKAANVFRPRILAAFGILGSLRGRGAIARAPRRMRRQHPTPPALERPLGLLGFHSLALLRPPERALGNAGFLRGALHLRGGLRAGGEEISQPLLGFLERGALLLVGGLLEELGRRVRRLAEPLDAHDAVGGGQTVGE